MPDIQTEQPSVRKPIEKITLIPTSDTDATIPMVPTVHKNGPLPTGDEDGPTIKTASMPVARMDDTSTMQPADTSLGISSRQANTDHKLQAIESPTNTITDTPTQLDLSSPESMAMHGPTLESTRIENTQIGAVETPGNAAHMYPRENSEPITVTTPVAETSHNTLAEPQITPALPTSSVTGEEGKTVSALPLPKGLVKTPDGIAVQFDNGLVGPDTDELSKKAARPEFAETTHQEIQTETKSMSPFEFSPEAAKKAIETAMPDTTTHVDSELAAMTPRISDTDGLTTRIDPASEKGFPINTDPTLPVITQDSANESNTTTEKINTPPIPAPDGSSEQPVQNFTNNTTNTAEQQFPLPTATPVPGFETPTAAEQPSTPAPAAPTASGNPLSRFLRMFGRKK